MSIWFVWHVWQNRPELNVVENLSFLGDAKNAGLQHTSELHALVLGDVRIIANLVSRRSARSKSRHA